MEQTGPQTITPPPRRRRKRTFAVLLILIGLIALAAQLFPSGWIRWEIIWPVVFIVVGFYLLKERK